MKKTYFQLCPVLLAFVLLTLAQTKLTAQVFYDHETSMSIANEQISLNEVQLSETNPSESEAEVLTLKIKSLVVFNQSITEQHTVPNAIEESVKFYVKLNTNEQGDVENWRNYLMDLFQQ